MSTDLGRALAEIVDDAHGAAHLAPAEAIVAHRRRRRAVRRGAGGAGLVCVAALGIVAATNLGVLAAPAPAPAPAASTSTSPAPTGTAAPPAEAPSCGQPLPAPGADLTISVARGTTGEPLSLTLTAPATALPDGTDAGDVTLALAREGTVVALGGVDEADESDRIGVDPTTVVDVVVEPCGDGQVDAGTYDALVVVTTPTGAVVSGSAAVELDENEAVAPGGGAAPEVTDDAQVDEVAVPDDLPPLLVQRFTGVETFVSATPGDPLADGSYVGYLVAADPGGSSVTVDLAVMHAGDAALDRLVLERPDVPRDELALLPEAMSRVVNEVANPRTLALAPQARAAIACTTGAGIELRESTWAELQPSAAFAPGCSWSTRAGGNALVWVDVRGGLVHQVAGQYRS